MSVSDSTDTINQWIEDNLPSGGPKSIAHTLNKIRKDRKEEKAAANRKNSQSKSYKN